MKLTALLKLNPTPDQAKSLAATLERVNQACDAISQTAWDNQEFKQFNLHQLSYKPIRETFGLAAQVVVRAIAKVADAYKLDKKVPRRFRPHGGIAYDDRILSFKKGDRVSIWTLDGRQNIPFVCGDKQRELLATRKGEADLIYRQGKFYLAVTCEVTEAPPQETQDALGVDLGIGHIATDSDGKQYSGAEIETNRRTFFHRRRNLQRKNTRAARRKLRQLKQKQANFQRNENHCISKAIVAKAEGTGCAVGLEELTHTRKQITAQKAKTKKHRCQLANWSYHQLRSFIEYKGQRAGVPVVLVDKKNTSRECSRCHHIDKKNRKHDKFKCRQCGYSNHADINAALNIKARAIVNRPNIRKDKVASAMAATSSIHTA